jgi:hypothetical protein
MQTPPPYTLVGRKPPAIYRISHKSISAGLRRLSARQKAQDNLHLLAGSAGYGQGREF